MASLQFNLTIGEKIEDSILESLEENGIKTTTEIKANAPVLTGDLRREYKYLVDKEGTKCTLTIGNKLDYSIPVEFKPQSMGGRPHFRKSFQGVGDNIIKTIKQKLERV